MIGVGKVRVCAHSNVHTRCSSPPRIRGLHTRRHLGIVHEVRPRYCFHVGLVQTEAHQRGAQATFQPAVMPGYELELQPDTVGVAEVMVSRSRGELVTRVVTKHDMFLCVACVHASLCHSPSVRPLCVGPEHLTVGHVHGGAVRAQPDDARGVGVGAAWLGVTCGARTRQGAVGHSRGQHSWARFIRACAGYRHSYCCC